MIINFRQEQSSVLFYLFVLVFGLKKKENTTSILEEIRNKLTSDKNVNTEGSVQQNDSQDVDLAAFDTLLSDSVVDDSASNKNDNKQGNVQIENTDKSFSDVIKDVNKVVQNNIELDEKSHEQFEDDLVSGLGLLDEGDDGLLSDDNISPDKMKIASEAPENKKSSQLKNISGVQNSQDLDFKDNIPVKDSGKKIDDDNDEEDFDEDSESDNQDDSEDDDLDEDLDDDLDDSDNDEEDFDEDSESDNQDDSEDDDLDEDLDDDLDDSDNDEEDFDEDSESDNQDDKSLNNDNFNHGLKGKPKYINSKGHQSPLVGKVNNSSVKAKNLNTANKGTNNSLLSKTQKSTVQYKDDEKKSYNLGAVRSSDANDKILIDQQDQSEMGISPQVIQNTKGSIERLMETVKNQIADKNSYSKNVSGKTIEQFFFEIAEPRIVSFLERHLEQIVNNVVEREIRKVIEDKQEKEKN